MMLPKVDQPTYEVTLLSQDKPVRFRPFLVKEQRLMMMASEAKDLDATIKAIKQIITNCSIDPIDAEDLPLADLETFFLNLRARSMGEVLNLYFKCTNQVQDIQPNTLTQYPQYKPCDMVLEVPVNIFDIKLINKDTERKIMVGETVGVIMRYPTLELVDRLAKSKSSEIIFTIVTACIDQVFDNDNVYSAKDATQAEMEQFVENLPTDAFDKLEEFVKKVPKSRYETKKKCTKCGFEHNFVLEGLSDFFL